MFIKNKYYKCYFNIIYRAKSRKLSTDVYVEKHHILPKSLGGNNLPENIVKLTAREHFICHLLLLRFTTGQSRHKMVFASMRLARGKNTDNRIKLNSRCYEHLKLLWSIAQKAHWADPNYRQNQIEKHKKIYDNPEYRKHLSDIQKQLHVEHPEIGKKKARPGKLNGMYGKTHSDEVKAKLSQMRKEELTDKTYEELHGTEKAKQLKTDRSKKLKAYCQINPEARKGSNNGNAKTCIILSPNGLRFETKSLKTFCYEHQLSYAKMSATARGERSDCNGWQVKYH